MNRMILRLPDALLTAGACIGLLGACGASKDAPTHDAPVITMDGSSTVYPISEAVAEEFQKTHAARVTIGVSGTGGGFKRFCTKEAVIAGASRPIKPSEVSLCETQGVDYIELAVAYDGLAVVVHKDNTWVDHLTVDELKRIWEPGAQGKIMSWSQVRDGFPKTPLRLFGPGVDSGTYDYFTKAIVGTEHASRGDFTSSEDDNVLVTGVSRDKGGLAFFGFAYYAENASVLKIVPIQNGDNAPVIPTLETVAKGTYQPLSRPIFIYVSKKASATPAVAAFVDYWFLKGSALVAEVGYIPLPPETYELVHQRFKKGVTGSVFQGKGSTIGVSVEDLLRSDR